MRHSIGGSVHNVNHQLTHSLTACWSYARVDMCEHAMWSHQTQQLVAPEFAIWFYSNIFRLCAKFCVYVNKTCLKFCEISPQTFCQGQGRIIKCVQCACAHEASPHWRPHHQADVNLSCWSLSLRCKLNKTTTKEGHQILRWKKCGGPTKTVHTLPR